MIRREGSRLVLSGAVTLGNAAALLDEGKRHLAEGVQTVDLGEVSEMDSALLALLLAWLREARLHDRTLVFTNLPESLRTIARLYGVDRLLPTS
ncbi:MAG TPA: STAS domain-containing protein [Burkholderiales bacterium]|jgi:phospholipid transport system transporter-binding protein